MPHSELLNLLVEYMYLFLDCITLSANVLEGTHPTMFLFHARDFFIAGLKLLLAKHDQWSREYHQISFVPQHF